MAMRGLTLMLVGTSEAYSLLGVQQFGARRAGSAQMICASDAGITESWYYEPGWKAVGAKIDFNDPSFGDNTYGRREQLASTSTPAEHAPAVSPPAQPPAQISEASETSDAAKNWYYQPGWKAVGAKIDFNDPSFGDNTYGRREQLASSTEAGTGAPTAAAQGWYKQPGWKAVGAKIDFNDPSFGDNTYGRREQLASSTEAATGAPTSAAQGWYYQTEDWKPTRDPTFGSNGAMDDPLVY